MLQQQSWCNGFSVRRGGKGAGEAWEGPITPENSPASPLSMQGSGGPGTDILPLRWLSSGICGEGHWPTGKSHSSHNGQSTPGRKMLLIPQGCCRLPVCFPRCFFPAVAQYREEQKALVRGGQVRKLPSLYLILVLLLGCSLCLTLLFPSHFSFLKASCYCEHILTVL